MSDIRAVAVGVPERLRERLEYVDGVRVCGDLVAAAMVLSEAPHAAVMYGEALFGEAVTGQPVLLLDEQGGLPSDEQPPPFSPRVLVVSDLPPNKLSDLDWDDPRKLGVQAMHRLRAKTYIDLSETGVLEDMDQHLTTVLALPPNGGYSESNGNDEPNGDPDAEDHRPPALG